MQLTKALNFYYYKNMIIKKHLKELYIWYNR